jgi:methylated-DNA-[protein]-cysteine S-methyltransferase
VYDYVLPSPVGGLGLIVVDGTLAGVHFGADGRRVLPPTGPTPAVLYEAVSQLNSYFAGGLKQFDLPMTVLSGSEFERQVWRVISTIPYGETMTYGAIATEIGDPGSARAVGVACNHNPLPIVVPCHRVVGAGGKLVGFGGGLDRKRILLNLELSGSFEQWFS